SRTTSTSSNKPIGLLTLARKAVRAAAASWRKELPSRAPASRNPILASCSRVRWGSPAPRTATPSPSAKRRGHARHCPLHLPLAPLECSSYSDDTRMSIYSIQPLTFGGVRTYPLASRKSKVNVGKFARAVDRKASLTKFLDSLPRILAAQDLRELLSAIHRARKHKKAILWGLGPVLIDLMRRGFVSGIAMNGAALIHDFEIALAGSTSEDVEAALGEGHFGMAEETGTYINEIAKLAYRIRVGYG